MKKTSPWRFYFILLVLFLCALGLIWRMVDLNLLQRKFLLEQSNARTLRKVNIPAYRGMIIDRLGTPLAISTPVDAIWIDPHIFQPAPQQLQQLAKGLGLSDQFISRRWHASKSSHFAYLKRGVPLTTAKMIKALNIPGVFLEKEYKRFYPESEVAAHVVGFTNIDDQGQAGLELAYNNWLRGIPGKKWVVKDRLGHVIANMRVVREPAQGRNLALSIDHRIQYLAYRVLDKAIKANNAQSGSVVVLDPKTGEILAMVNEPSFDPNHRGPDINGCYRNRAVTDMFEPGSVMKAFSLAAALSSGKYTPTTAVNTNPGWMVIDGHTIKDADGNNGVISVTQVLQRSSNIGAARMTLSLPPSNLIDLLRQFGFTQRTASGFPGEVSGKMVQHLQWRQIDMATLSFGYAISVTTLQLAHAYAVIADNGIKVPVTFLKRTQAPSGMRVMSEEVDQQMMTMLQSAVETGGTGFRAKVRGYHVAGKTGTAHIAGPHGYYKDRYVSSFVGIAPINNPKLVIAVVIRNPQSGRYYASQIAAPAFAKIMGGALRILDVPPDNLAHI